MYSWKQNGGNTLNAHKLEIEAMSEKKRYFLDRKLKFSLKMGHGISSWNKVGSKTPDSCKFEIKAISEKIGNFLTEISIFYQKWDLVCRLK